MPLMMFCFFACEQEEISKEVSVDDLNQMKADILTLAQSRPCTDDTDWQPYPLGSKPCGGPAEYFAYHVSVDTSKLFAMVANYNEAHKSYNEQNKIGSDCSLTQQPSGVACKQNAPVLLYNQ